MNGVMLQFIAKFQSPCISFRRILVPPDDEEGIDLDPQALNGSDILLHPLQVKSVR